MFNWLMDHVFDREGARLMREELARFDDNCRMVDDLNRRVRASFTDEEWKDTEARCEAMLHEGPAVVFLPCGGREVTHKHASCIAN